MLLHTVAEAAEDAVQRGLTQLQAADFLYETRLFPDPEYTFKHALTHDVTYGTLLQDRRVWVMNLAVQSVEQTINIPLSALDRVRGVEGVRFAARGERLGGSFFTPKRGWWFRRGLGEEELPRSRGVTRTLPAEVGSQRIAKAFYGVDGNLLVEYLPRDHAVVEATVDGRFKPTYGPSSCCRFMFHTYPQLADERGKRLHRRIYRGELEARRQR